MHMYCTMCDDMLLSTKLEVGIGDNECSSRLDTNPPLAP